MLVKGTLVPELQLRFATPGEVAPSWRAGGPAPPSFLAWGRRGRCSIFRDLAALGDPSRPGPCHHPSPPGSEDQDAEPVQLSIPVRPLRLLRGPAGPAAALPRGELARADSLRASRGPRPALQGPGWRLAARGCGMGGPGGGARRSSSRRRAGSRLVNEPEIRPRRA